MVEKPIRNMHRISTCLAAVGVAPVPEDEGADRPGDVADAVGRQRRDDRDRGIGRGEEDLRKDQATPRWRK